MHGRVNFLLASSNRGKLAEFEALARRDLADSRFTFSLAPDFAKLPAFEEAAPTFAENAAGKAIHYSRFCDGAVIADDSGLVVPALKGAPGVRSARYAGPNATDAEKIAKLLAEMRGKRGAERAAHFVCVLALAESGRCLAVVSDRADGMILEAPRGNDGFGYDPVFYQPEINKTFAELSRAEKNRASHRGKAFRRLLRAAHDLFDRS
ncbi:MAG TPA: RdgB/HAM1 family non-canonical purine NTP pyrophosphatase [Candidatus Acidoferrales bacterium]|nr:RdgB/HAM1 family non-canonical purine NTP pyrophosphatase [Candidatus Acidoferrales bacterium]